METEAARRSWKITVVQAVVPIVPEHKRPYLPCTRFRALVERANPPVYQMRTISSEVGGNHAAGAIEVPALRLSGLCKSFDKPAVKQLDLTIAPGEFYALLGPNGAGKTTTLRMVAGLLPADAGEIEIFGVDARKDIVEAKKITAWLPDEPMLYDKLDPIEYLEFVAGLWNVPSALAEERAVSLLTMLGLWEHRRERCEGFSRGMKQKVALAGALVHEPKLLMLDEPLTGLDAAVSRQVKDLLMARVRAGATIILTTHILEVAERLADRIGIIQNGELIAEGTLEELRSRARKGDGGQTAAGSASLEDVFLELTSSVEQAA